MTSYDHTLPTEPNRSLLYAEVMAQISGKALTHIDFTASTTTLGLAFDTALTAGEETAVSAAVVAHDPEPLTLLKVRLVDAASAYYTVNRDVGFTYDSNLFTGNVTAIAHLNTGKQKANSQAYPIVTPTKNGVSYSVPNATELDNIFDAMADHARAHLEAFAVASDNIVTAATKVDAQAAYDAYAV